MIHMEYYLVVSTIMMFAGIWILYPPEYTGYPDFCGANAERHGHQLRRVQPFSLSGRNGRLFLCTILYRHFGC